MKTTEVVMPKVTDTSSVVCSRCRDIGTVYTIELHGGKTLVYKSLPCQVEHCHSAVKRWAAKREDPKNKEQRVFDATSIPRFYGEQSLWNETELAIIRYMAHGLELNDAKIDTLTKLGIDVDKCLRFAEAILPTKQQKQEPTKPQVTDKEFETLFAVSPELDEEIPF